MREEMRFVHADLADMDFSEQCIQVIDRQCGLADSRQCVSRFRPSRMAKDSVNADRVVTCIPVVRVCDHHILHIQLKVRETFQHGRADFPYAHIGVHIFRNIFLRHFCQERRIQQKLQYHKQRRPYSDHCGHCNFKPAEPLAFQ